MKKIMVRKPGSVRLTSAAVALYLDPTCGTGPVPL
jgi:hypothetical protein